MGPLSNIDINAKRCGAEQGGRIIAGSDYLVIYILQYIYFSFIMLNMINLNIDTDALLKQLGDRLKEARLSRNESQDLFAQRLGITRQSYSKMEKGSPNTPIGNWLTASAILGRLGGWKDVLTAQEDLFEQFKRIREKRQRSGGRRKEKR